MTGRAKNALSAVKFCVHQLLTADSIGLETQPSCVRSLQTGEGKDEETKSNRRQGLQQSSLTLFPLNPKP